MDSSTYDEMQGTSPAQNRMSLPLPITVTQSAPPFVSAPRSLPPPLGLDPSESPSQPSQSMSKSPVDDGSGAALRLPSITRHGFLVDGVPRSTVGQSPQTGMKALIELFKDRKD